MSKVLKLVASNVKRLTAIEVTPQGTVTTIGGKNGAGKSSVLDAIAYAAGGSKLIPEEPIRKGETKAEIEVTLNDYVIVRKFTRDRLPCTCKREVGHEEDCDYRKFGPTRSGLAVKTREGASYPSPQAVLDDLFGQLTFDPLSFFNTPDKQQAEMLRRLVGLDTGELDFKRKEAYDKRTEVNRLVANLEGTVKNLPFFEGVPEKEIPVEEISKEMLTAQELRTAADDAERRVSLAGAEITRVKDECQRRYSEIEMLQKRIEALQDECAKFEVQLGKEEENLKILAIAATEARAKVPAMDSLQARLSEVDETNRKVRANRQYQTVTADLDLKRKNVLDLTMQIKNFDEEREKMLRALKFPIQGLALGDAGVLWNGIPLAQASTAERLQISVAIGMALNPKVKVLLIRNGNTLDEDSLKIISDLAEKHDYQVWLEWVTKSKDGVSVLIEDGHIAQ